MRGPERASASRGEAMRLHAAGDLAAAEPLYRVLLDRRGDDPELLYLLALLRFQGGHHAEALRPLRRALRLRPGDASAWMLAGLCEAGRGRPAEAVEAYDRALALAPARWDVHANRAAALLALGRFGEALAAAERAAALQPHAAEAHTNRGDALRGLGRPEEAAAAYAEALASAPGLAAAAEGRAAALAALPPDALNREAIREAEHGRLDEALALLDRAIAAAPGEPVFLYNYGLFGRFAPGHPHLDALAALAERAEGLDTERAVYLRFALGKAASDGGEHGRAFAEYARGNALMRARIAHDPAAVERLAERVRAAFPAGGAWPAAPAGPGPRPVFVVGVPRSGSTLIERVVAGHPRAAALGETDAFRRALDALGAPSPEDGAALDGTALADLAARYRALSPPAPPGAEVVVDKTLVNLWHVGLIRRALPAARFVHAARDGRDAGLSCFEQLFNTAQPYAYDLAEIGRYIRAAGATLDHWRAVLPPGDLLDMPYEDLVADPERQARRLLAHCGLGWDPACLDLARGDGRVSTASLAQVRRPVSGASVGRWRRHAAALQPLIDALDGR